MRWNEKNESPRNRRGFLWLPKTIGGVTRWLEWAKWEEAWLGEPDAYDCCGYRPLRWLDLPSNEG